MLLKKYILLNLVILFDLNSNYILAFRNPLLHKNKNLFNQLISVKLSTPISSSFSAGKSYMPDGNWGPKVSNSNHETHVSSFNSVTSVKPSIPISSSFSAGKSYMPDGNWGPRVFNVNYELDVISCSQENFTKPLVPTFKDSKFYTTDSNAESDTLEVLTPSRIIINKESLTPFMLFMLENNTDFNNNHTQTSILKVSSWKKMSNPVYNSNSISGSSSLDKSYMPDGNWGPKLNIF